LINEEFGFVGGSFVILLFAGLIFRICYLAHKAKEFSGKIVSLSVAALIFFQFLLMQE